ncbi:hypothetical protein [Gracilibacillus dipsosauri]|uniref:hypothetical protein n=1 Tax=Gracilibacillus dipsosauri TaxID=178340 RepID=UPI00240A4BD4
MFITQYLIEVKHQNDLYEKEQPLVESENIEPLDAESLFTLYSANNGQYYFKK